MRAVNLLTSDQRSAPKGKGSNRPAVMEAPGGIGAIVVLGALALCVAALAGYVLSNNVVKERKAQLTEVSAQNAATVEKARKLKPYADFQTLARDRAGTVQALASARFDWEQALRDLSRAMPKEVYLSGLDGSIGSAAGGGSSLRGAVNSPAIELKGCTKSQPAVATLMSRMRNVQGVTRVSLSKSDKDAGAGGAPGSGAAGAVNPCGKGAPPSFEVVIFFERSSVAGALAGATGAVDPAAAAAAGSAPTTPAASPTPSGSKPAPTTPPAAAVTGGAK
jgi:Tfp pilus assembly protein PilN